MENIILVKAKRQAVRLQARGIDRLDSTLGYIDGNCVAACTDCNFAKQSLSADAFIALAKRIAAHHT